MKTAPASLLASVLVAISLSAATAQEVAREPDTKARLDATILSGLTFRSLGPALTSGRIGDIAVHPTQRSTWYVAVASGGVWKTINAGTTWTLIFDGERSYSIGCVTIDEQNPLVVWVGTGENNSQRSVAYGDGVYKSVNGGKSWRNVGLKNSEHIARIVIDPRDSNVVYVASQGPLWNPGGERGLYKTEDGGETWKRVLEISDDTGVTDLVMHPLNPDVLLAAAYQRRRHVWSLIDGGPESAIFKSTDAGSSWTKLESGLPREEMGRIGLAISPVDPDVVYAVIESVNKAGGFYRSSDEGWTWEKRGDYSSGSAQYYHELVADPHEVDRVYALDTWIMVTENGGKSFTRLGERFKHVDNHALWIEPEHPSHLIAGCDGGVYESFDRGVSWAFKQNLPVTQFYRVTVDNAEPFYNVYGGTQDNFTLGGPSRTTTAHGILNADWFVTTGGDGFYTQVDPDEPAIVYSESQYGGLARFDRRTGERIDIQPQPGPGEPPLRWNWDSPLLLSSHAHTRLYFAADRIFRSDDRGNSWTAISPDLTRKLDRNKIKMMGRVWSVDSIAKNASTSFYGNLVALAESPLEEGLLYAGTDDGLIQVTENGGETWRRIEVFPVVPEQTYVSRLVASQHDANVVYATFDNHKMGDFKPYALKSVDRGQTWTSIAGDLPERGTVYALAEDFEQPLLLFAGTEFGVFCTTDGGTHWIQLKAGLPVIQVRDLAIQKRESDLVVATFGRGFYVLDDYSPLRAASEELLAQDAALLPVKRAWMYIPSTPLGLPDKAFQGAALFAASNPPFGAVLTYYLKDDLKTQRKRRQEAERAKRQRGEDVFYPTWDELRAEDREDEPEILLTISDVDGNVVRRLNGPAGKGFQRVSWDLRYPAATPTADADGDPDDPFSDPNAGPLVAPGMYRVALASRAGGKLTELSAPVELEAAILGTATLPAEDRHALVAFERQTARLQRAVMGAVECVRETEVRLAQLKKALRATPGTDGRLEEEARAIAARLKDLAISLQGDATLARRNEPTPPAIVQRVQSVVGGHWSSTSDATATQRRDYEIAADQFGEVLEKLRALVTVELKQLEDAAETAGAPWTPGRVPVWQKE